MECEIKNYKLGSSQADFFFYKRAPAILNSHINHTLKVLAQGKQHWPINFFRKTALFLRGCFKVAQTHPALRSISCWADFIADFRTRGIFLSNSEYFFNSKNHKLFKWNPSSLCSTESACFWFVSNRLMLNILKILPGIFYNFFLPFPLVWICLWSHFLCAYPNKIIT